MKEVARGWRKSGVMQVIADAWVDESPRNMPPLELALLREGVERRDAGHERCSRCHRTPLAGELVYLADTGPVLCELCCSEEAIRSLRSRRVRGPWLGRSIRILSHHAT
jgi:hypothetical protein